MGHKLSERLKPEWVAQKLNTIEYMLKEVLERLSQKQVAKEVTKRPIASREPTEKLLTHLDESTGEVSFTRIPIGED